MHRGMACALSAPQQSIALLVPVPLSMCRHINVKCSECGSSPAACRGLQLASPPGDMAQGVHATEQEQLKAALNQLDASRAARLRDEHSDSLIRAAYATLPALQDATRGGLAQALAAPGIVDTLWAMLHPPADVIRQHKAVTQRAGRVHAVLPGAAVSNRNCIGSCVVIDANGHAITNEHVTKGLNAGEQLVVVLPDLNSEFTADVEKADAQLDLALIKPSQPRRIDVLTPLSFDYANTPGTLVLCASFPQVVQTGMKTLTPSLDPSPTVSRGHVIFASVGEWVADYTAYPNSSGAGVLTDTLGLAGIHTGQISPHVNIDTPKRTGDACFAAFNEQLQLKTESPVFASAETVERFVYGREVGPELAAARDAAAGQAAAAKHRRFKKAQSMYAATEAQAASCVHEACACIRRLLQQGQAGPVGRSLARKTPKS